VTDDIRVRVEKVAEKSATCSVGGDNDEWSDLFSQAPTPGGTD